MTRRAIVLSLVHAAASAAWWFSFWNPPRSAGTGSLSPITTTASWTAGPIRVRRVEMTCLDGPIRGLVAIIDLRDPRLEAVVTQPLTDAPPKVEARLEPTDKWMARMGCILAINANFFGRLPADDTVMARARGWIEGDNVDILGLSVSDGHVVSPAMSWKGRSHPALVITSRGSASVGYLPGRDDAGGVCAVAGIGATDAEPRLGTLLVQNRVNLGETARAQPTKRHPRTAAGVSADGRTLILAAVDGRQEDYSVGITLPELGDLMIAHGANDAVNLDGGGSTTLIFEFPGNPGDKGGKTGERVTSRPSDGKFRAVANHLGFRLRGPVQGVSAHDP